MAQETTISWTDSTWNPTAGCTAIAPGCDNCYAATMSRRLEAMGSEKYNGLAVHDNGTDKFTGKIALDEQSLFAPLRWKKPRRIFVNSMSDLFHKDVPAEFVTRVFAVMLSCPQHIFQVLTKRPGRAARYMSQLDIRDIEWAAPQIKRTVHHVFPIRNIEMGASISCQKTADQTFPQLTQSRRFFETLFVSCEPMLDHVAFGESWLKAVNLVIFGGESGAGSRVCDVDWIRSGVQQCRNAGTNVFVKQMGANVRDRGLVSGRDPQFDWPRGTKTKRDRIYLKNRKGEDINEWPLDLRIREYASNQSYASGRLGNDG